MTLASTHHTHTSRNTTTTRIVGYFHGPSRVSYENRIDFLLVGAAFADLSMVAVFGDEDVGGANASWPELEQAIALVAAGEAQGVLVEDLKRLARQTAIVPQLWARLNALKAQLWDQSYGRITPTKLQLAARGMPEEVSRDLKRLRATPSEADLIHGSWPRRITRQ